LSLIISKSKELTLTKQGEEFLYYNQLEQNEFYKQVELHYNKFLNKYNDEELTNKYKKFLKNELWTNFIEEAEKYRKDVIKKDGEFHKLISLLDKCKKLPMEYNFGSRGTDFPNLNNFPNLRAIQLIEVYLACGIFPEIMTSFSKISEEQKKMIIDEYSSENLIVVAMITAYDLNIKNFAKNFEEIQKYFSENNQENNIVEENKNAVENFNEIKNEILKIATDLSINKKNVNSTKFVSLTNNIPNYRYSHDNKDIGDIGDTEKNKTATITKAEACQVINSIGKGEGK
jgi:hypothetical protein